MSYEKFCIKEILSPGMIKFTYIKILFFMFNYMYVCKYIDVFACVHVSEKGVDPLKLE